MPGPVYAVYALLLLSAALALLWAWDGWADLRTLIQERATVWEVAREQNGLLLQVYLMRVWLIVYGVACLALALLLRRGSTPVLWGVVAVMVLDLAVKIVHMLLRQSEFSFASAAAEFIYPAVILALVLTPAFRAFFGGARARREAVA